MYELIFITDTLNEKIDFQALEKVRGFIAGLEGNIKKEDSWEKRKLAYPVKKRFFGFYTIIQFQMESEKINDLQKQLKMDDDILRYLIIDKTKIKEEAPRLKFARPKAAPQRPAEEKDEKIKIEEIDKKLEEILKE